MADPPRHSDTRHDDTPVEPSGSTAGTPRWVKVFGLVALVVLMLFVVVVLFGGGKHGPGRHADSPRGHTGPPAGFEHRDRQP